MKWGEVKEKLKDVPDYAEVDIILIERLDLDNEIWHGQPLIRVNKATIKSFDYSQVSNRRTDTNINAVYLFGLVY